MRGIQNTGIKFANFLLLARAVYQNKKLYLIDDIFSAVDGHVAAHIYRKCILGEFYSILYILFMYFIYSLVNIPIS